MNPAKPSNDSQVPRRFVDFTEWLGVRLSTGQRALCRIAYDGDRLDALEPDEREAAIKIFGPIPGTVPLAARGVVGAICGGRAGKTYVLLSLRMVHGLLVRDLSSLAPGQRAVALVVAPNDKLRQEALNYALGAMRSRPELAKLLILPKGSKEEDTPTSFGVRRGDHVVTFESGVATRGGYGGRGRSLTDFGMDESCFFRDASFKINDKDIFEAASSRVLPGGQTIVASTPWAESGLLYDMWSRNYGKPTDALVAHAPTLLLNPSDWARAIVERERLRDPDNANREFDAKFMSGGTTVFFEASTIQAAIDETLSCGREPRPGETVAAGADLAFVGDSAALAIVHRDELTMHVGLVEERRPEPGKPLKPSETVADFVTIMKAHGCTHAVGDGHYAALLQEYLTKSAMAYCPAPTVPSVAYVRARVLFREGRVRIPNNPRLIQQLREVQGRPMAGGRISISNPRWASGGHGDLVSALVLALYQLGGDEIKAEKAPEGSTEWEAAFKEQRRRKAEEQSKANQWERGGSRNPFGGRS